MRTVFKVVTTRKGIVGVLRQAFTKDHREHLIRVDVDRYNKVFGYEVVSIGTHDHAPLSTRDFFRGALTVGSHKVIVAHTHPDDDSTPSEGDYDATERIIEAGAALDIAVIEHVIIGSNGPPFYMRRSGKRRLDWGR